MDEITYRILGMSCAHCAHAVTGALAKVEGVDSVDLDTQTKVVTVRGGGLDDAVLRAAVDEAGYHATVA